MYFKRLELFGFKSFAERTKIKFEPGVTAVVGPNGCGKSNIADSIKWVLGEQSAKELRGSRMEDVIFSGTSNKEPINMAEVSLVLSNKDKILPIDYEEVIITRRLFRSGESEYLLNKMPVRLKDINDLLAGTGIGQSSYSMIEQGRIGQILSSRPEDRRFLLEEASGITKYKAKKKEALKKLEHTENNLVRITDIITEVHRQIQSIERQAKKAEKYKKDFELLKDDELKYSSFKYRNIMNELKTITIENEDLKKREEELVRLYSAFNAEAQESRALIDRISDELQRTQGSLSVNSATIDKTTHNISMDKERIEELKAVSENLGKEVEGLGKKLVDKRNTLEALEKELIAIATRKTDKENVLLHCEDTVGRLAKEIQAHNENIKVSKLQILDIETAQTKIKNELIKIGAEIQGRKTRLRRLKAEKENVTREKTDFDNKVLEVIGRLESSKNEVLLQKESLTGFKEGFSRREESLKAIHRSVSDLRGRQEVLKSKRELLVELIEKNEGFNKGVKAIMDKCKDSAFHIKAVLLADIISAEQGFEQAAENALGELAQSMIVDNKEEAICLLDVLKNEDLGRAHFLICKDIVKESSFFVKRPPSDARPLLDFIKCGDNHSDVVNYIFKDTYVVESPDVADRLFSQFNSYRFVTREGYLRQGPRVFGGAIIEADTSVIGRKKRVEEIEQELSGINVRLETEISREGEEERVLAEEKVKINQTEAVLREAELLFANIESERQSLLGNVKRIYEEETVLDTEIQDEEQTVNDLTARGETLNHELNAREEENANAQTLILNYESIAKEKVELKESTLLKIASVKGELSSIQISYDNALANRNMRSEECLEIEKEVESKKLQIHNASIRVEQLSNEVVQLEKDMQVLLENRVSLEAKRDDLISQKSQAIAEFEKKETALREQETQIDLIKNNIRDLDIKITEVRFKKTSLLDRMDQAYRVDLSGLNIEIDDNTDWEAVQEEIEELKLKLERMGAVNLVAIEEHKELAERYSFLTHQKDDLVNAKESLHKAIIKINATTRKLFLETFQRVQVEFRNYFKMLFGGGQAEIFLLDERDVLESGIEIVVRPPGKKLQNILLLSGGEKALTAIALLFALFKVNPSPFCVLDEIDAPLDETNIDRFTRVLQEFLKISQFIIITHNKKTIQMADALYGITMAEKGVSKIVSVKFSDKVKEENKEEVLV